MEFDAATFLMRVADAFNSRDVAALRSHFALDDPRFTVFEEFSDDLLCGPVYEGILESAREATSRMSFEVLTCDVFGEHALVHAIQRLMDDKAEPGLDEMLVRVTMCVALAEETPRIASAHFSSMLLCFPKRASVYQWRKSA